MDLPTAYILMIFPCIVLNVCVFAVFPVNYPIPVMHPRLHSGLLSPQEHQALPVPGLALTSSSVWNIHLLHWPQNWLLVVCRSSVKCPSLLRDLPWPPTPDHSPPSPVIPSIHGADHSFHCVFLHEAIYLQPIRLWVPWSRACICFFCFRLQSSMGHSTINLLNNEWVTQECWTLSSNKWQDSVYQSNP